jgi:succinate-acetate transporter protein
MATEAQPQTRGFSNGNAAEFDRWQSSTRVVLQPIAAPSVLGLYGFAAATFMVATNLAGWWGNAHSAVYMFPFAVAFGGFAQFAAALWSYKARDALATAIHGAWGSFWIGYGILFAFVAAGDIHVVAGKLPALAFFLFPLAAITAAGMLAALAENLSIASVLAVLWVGAGLLGVGYLVGGTGWIQAGGWVLAGSAVIAFYAASALMLKAAYGRVILPVGELKKEANIPGRQYTHPIEYHYGEPGVKMGQ